MHAVVAETLSKTFNENKKAVDGIHLALKPGEVFGFLGPNGAGKTTTVKLLTGMMAPTGGTCRVFGISPQEHPEQVHGISGVVTEHAQMYDNLTGRENLQFYGTVFGLNRSESGQQAGRLLELLELTDAGNQKLASYSTGMRQRLSLARAMMHKPKVLFLDEPTSGLDPESVQRVNGMIKSLAEREGITVFLCTHQLRYAQEICSSYGLMANGKLLAAGDIDSLRARVFSGVTVLMEADWVPEGLKCERLGERRVRFCLPSKEEIPAIVQSIVEHGSKVYEVTAQELSLEEIYFALLEQRQSGKGASK